MSRQKSKDKDRAGGRLFVITGPSGSGKTTLSEIILKKQIFKGRIEKSISFTTRPKRSGEQDKKDYFFIQEDQFKRELKAKKILEWVRYLGYYYGTPKKFVDQRLSKGKHIIMCVDLKGAARLKRIYPRECVTIFIMPPSLKELRERIEKRSDNIQAKEVNNRVSLAEKEILAAGSFDYCLLNKDLAKTAEQLKRILIRHIRNGD